MKRVTGWIADDRTFFNEEDKSECKLYEECIMPFLAFDADGKICAPQYASIVIALSSNICEHEAVFEGIEDKGIYFFDNHNGGWVRMSYFPFIDNTDFLKMVNKYFNAYYKIEEEG